MDLCFSNKKISGLLCVLPAKEVAFEEELENYTFPPRQSLKLKTIMGYDKKRVVSEGTTVSDLCVAGLEYLFERKLLLRDAIDGLILVTQTPDYIMPATSSIIHGRLGLKEDMVCIDINQGCAGYIVGLTQAFMLLEQDEINKVVLLNADVLSLKVSKKDRNSNPLVGDAAAITIVEKSLTKNLTSVSTKTDGTGAFALHIPAGGIKLPSDSTTCVITEDSSGNLRSQDHLVMRGDEVFHFVQTHVPPLIENLLKKRNIRKEDIDYFMFHQPNKFMLNKLADKLNVSRDKMPFNVVEKFGNSSGASIPVAMALNASHELRKSKLRLCLAGFGVGLTWAAMIVDIEELEYCEIIEI